MLPIGINTSIKLYLTGSSLISSFVNTLFNAVIAIINTIFEVNDPNVPNA